MKDAVATMGGLLPDDAGGRDAVHVAVFSATSDEHLRPGTHVALVRQDGRDTKVSRDGDHIGIVDPFLVDAVRPGARFWVYIYPRTITGLSHRWSHPAFGDDDARSYAPPSGKLASEAWLRAFVARSDCPSYETIVKAASGDLADPNGDIYSYVDSNSFHFVGYDAGGEIPPEFWDHLENVTGRKITTRPAYFSCSC